MNWKWCCFFNGYTTWRFMSLVNSESLNYCWEWYKSSIPHECKAYIQRDLQELDQDILNKIFVNFVLSLTQQLWDKAFGL